MCQALMQQVVHRLVALVPFTKDDIDEIRRGNACKGIHLSPRTTDISLFLSSINTHPLFALRLRHLLNGVAEHGTRHLVSMLVEKVTEQIHGDALTQLAQHPPHSFVHQIMRMMQMDFGIAQAPRWVAHLGGFPRADDAHALFPEARAGSQFI